MSRSRRAYKALTSDSWHPHSHPAGWARSSLESRAKPQPGPRMPRPLKPLILVAAILAIGAALGTTAQPAQARSLSICSKALVHDWLVDGRVDKTYPVHCYREALKTIPRISWSTERCATISTAHSRTPSERTTATSTMTHRFQGSSRSAAAAAAMARAEQAAPAACSTGSPTRSDQHRRIGPGSPARPRRARTCVDRGRRNQLFRSPDAGPAGGGRSATRRTLLLDAARARTRLEKRPRGYTWGYVRAGF